MTKEHHIYYCYGLLRPDGSPFYVGKGKGKPRVADHVQNALRGRLGHKYNIIRKIIRGGNDVGYIEFASGLTERQAFDKEIEMIAAIGRRPNGPLVNETNGGDGTSGWKPAKEIILKRNASRRANGVAWHSEDTRAKMSASNTGHAVSVETKAKAVATRLANGSYRISEITRAKLSATSKGRKQSPDTISKRVATRRANGTYKHTELAKVKMSAAQKGRKASAESIAKAIATRRARGYWHSPTALAKQAASRIGRKHSDITRAKISSSKTGSRLSKVTRDKMSIAQKKRRELEKCVAYA